MDRRRFIATVGVASAAAAAATALGPGLGARRPDGRSRHHAPPDGGRQSLPRRPDRRSTTSRCPARWRRTSSRSTSLASPRALAQSALRLVSAYVNPTRRRAPSRRRAARTAADPAGALAEPAEPERSVRHRQPGQPAGHLVRDQRPGLGYDLLRRRRPAGDRRGPADVRGDHAAGRRRSLADGGVHTPNHRWEICKALAHLHHLWPSRLLLARINDWLGEGIDQDADGEYSERSPNYASEVTNRSLVDGRAATPTSRGCSTTSGATSS